MDLVDMGISGALRLLFRASWSIIVPIMIFVAARRLQGCVPDWIPGSMIVYSIVSFLSGLPSVLFALGANYGSISSWGLIFSLIGFVNFAASIAFACALLSLSARVRHTAIQLGAATDTRG